MIERRFRFQAACAEEEAYETACAAMTAQCERCDDKGSIAIIYCACVYGTGKQAADKVNPVLRVVLTDKACGGNEPRQIATGRKGLQTSRHH